MSDRIFRCGCQKCGTEFEFTGPYEKFNDFMNSEKFTCPSGHIENRPPRGFIKVMTMSEPLPILEWKPADGRSYVNILDFQTTRIQGMQMDHLGSGLYIDRRTRKKYDYEEDSKGNRHYFEIPVMAIAPGSQSSPSLSVTPIEHTGVRTKSMLRLAH
jgi:hypothetical protein